VLRYWLVFVGVIGLDQVAKLLVQYYLTPGQTIPVIGNLLHLTYMYNHGGAFGLFAGYVPLFLVSAIAVVLASAVYVLRNRPEARMEIALALVAGGAGGNLIDRVYLGYVVDYVDLGFWPVFNLADCAIVLGAAWMFYILVRPEPARGV